VSAEIIVLANRIQISDNEIPSRVLLVPWGNVTSQSGDFVVDADAAASVVAAFKERGLDLVIDRDHATLGGEFAPPNGEAPAMGWVHALHVEDGVGIHGDVNWTETGESYLRKREYRYLSPVTILRKSDRHLVKFHSVGLVNTPAIDRMVAIVNKETVVLDQEKLERTRWFLNLPETATAEEIMSELEKFLSQMRTMVGAASDANQETVVAALKQRITDGAEFRVAVCKAMNLADDVTADDVVVAINKATEKPTTPADVVPKTQHDEQLAAHKTTIDKQETRIKALEDQLHSRDREAFIDRGMKAGKIVAAHKGMWERSFDDDPKRAEEELAAAPVGAPAEGRLVTSAHGGGAVSRRGGDLIVANSHLYDESGMDRHRRVIEYKTAHKCSYKEAMKHVD